MGAETDPGLPADQAIVPDQGIIPDQAIAPDVPSIPMAAAGTAATIPDASVARLASYLHALRTFTERGAAVASSVELATAAGVNPSILRKDLSYTGANGVRGVGYDVARLTERINATLHTDSTHKVALAGAGRLGDALISHTGFGRGFRVAALFDADPDRIGSVFGDDLRVAPIGDIERVCRGQDGAGIEFAVIATDDADAQRACDAFVAAGIRQILNVTTATLSADSGIVIRHVDLALELQVLGFQAHALNAAGQRGRIVSTQNREARERGLGLGEETVTA